MDHRDDSTAKHVEDVFGKIADALRDTGASAPQTARLRDRPRRSFSELAPIVPYEIPPLVIGNDPPPNARSSRRVDRSRDHAIYAPPHAPRASIPPVSDFSTRRIIRTGARRPTSLASTISFFALVALTVVAMSAAALLYAKPEAKPGAARAVVAAPVLRDPTLPPAPTVIVPAAPIAPPVPSVVPTVVATRAVPAPTKPRGTRVKKSRGTR